MSETRRPRRFRSPYVVFGMAMALLAGTILAAMLLPRPRPAVAAPPAREPEKPKVTPVSFSVPDSSMPECCQVPSGRGSFLSVAAAPPAEAPTFHKDIAPVLQKNCQECHRGGQIGPFPLETFDQVRRHANDIATVTADRRMPPWLAEPGYGVKFAHDRSLPEDQIELFQAWVDAGTPEGDPDDQPPAPTFSDGWKLGTPDVIVELEEPFQVPAEGADIYRCFVIRNPLPEDAYVVGLEYQPGNARVVHHILGYVDDRGDACKLDASEEGPGYQCFGGPRINIRGDLGGWAPGANASFLPPGIGRVVPKGSDIVLQVHYHPSGKPETDRSRLGLYLAPKDSPIRQAMHWWAAAPDYEQIEKVDRSEHGVRFVIPGNESNYKLVCRTLPLPCDLDLVVVSPHMHKLGKDMEMYAELPAHDGQPGERIPLIRVPHWDFSWQLQYQLEKPLRLPKGTVVWAISHFDNSDSNPNREGPPGPVSEGEATYEEMSFGFFASVKSDQDLTKGDPDDLQKLFYGQIREMEEQSRKQAAERAGQAGD